MTELTRYDWGKRDDGEWDILPFTDGDYVKYADVAHLEQQTARLANLPELPNGWKLADDRTGYELKIAMESLTDAEWQFLAQLLNTCYPPAPGQEST